jgi:hypothetical protein
MPAQAGDPWRDAAASSAISGLKLRTSPITGAADTDTIAGNGRFSALRQTGSGESRQ